MKGRVHLIEAAIAIIVSVPASAGEYAVLDNGFRLHAERHEQDGSFVRLYENSGTVEIPASRISRFEAEEQVAPAGPVETHAADSTPPPFGSVQGAESPVELAHNAAAKLALPSSFESLVRSVMKAESGFNPAAVSPKGAIGLMQLMPGTAKQLNVDPKAPRENAEGGARYLRDLLARYEGKPEQVLLALAAYNAGPEAVEKYHGVPPFRETHEYILRVLRDWKPAAEKTANH